MPYADTAALKSHLDDLIGRASFWPAPAPRLEDARRDFLAAGPEICAPLAAALWEHYESLAPMWAMDANAATRESEGVPRLTDKSQVWAHIEAPYPPEIAALDDPEMPVRLPFQLTVAWYPGHSLTVVFQGASITLE